MDSMSSTCPLVRDFFLSFNALVSVPWANRHEVPMRPKSRCKFCPPPAQAPSSGLPKLPTSAESSMLRQPFLEAPLVRDLTWGKKRSRAELPFDGSQPKSCFDYLYRSKRQSICSIASHRLAPRAKRINRQPEPEPLISSTHLSKGIIIRIGKKNGRYSKRKREH